MKDWTGAEPTTSIPDQLLFKFQQMLRDGKLLRRSRKNVLQARPIDPGLMDMVDDDLIVSQGQDSDVV